MIRIPAFIASFCLLLLILPKIPKVTAAPVIAGVNLVVTCNTSVLVNFNTSTASHAFIEYGTSASYGSSTIDDSVRLYKEHAIQITGLNGGTPYHYRVIATDGTGTSMSADQTFTTATNSASCPALPSQVDSRMPDMTGAVERTVKASGGNYTPAQFQTALNDAGTANEKRIITIDAGLTLSGQFIMPANPDGNWIVIRPSTHASLAQGRRVFPSDASNMYKIQNVGVGNVDPPIIFAAASNHIRIIGAEVTIDPAAIGDAPGGAAQTRLIDYQQNVGGSAANLPRFIGIDRCYVHGHPSKNTMRGAQVLGEDLFFVDSSFVDFHHNGFDSQAILGIDVKRWKILNCTLNGSGENFMWGGTGLAISGYVIGELEYLHNHMFNPLSWKQDDPSYAGFEWNEKNLFECKTCAKVLLFGNYFGGITDSQGGFWPDGQSKAINLKLEQDSAGPTTCDLMEDIILYKNFGKNLHAGFDVVGRTVPAQGCTNNPARILLRDNLLELDSTFWDPDPDAASGVRNGEGFAISGTHHVQVIHNTIINNTPVQSGVCNSVFSDGSMLLVGDPVTNKWQGFVFKDNISDWRGCGLGGGGCNGTNATCSLDGVFIGWVFTNNGIMRAAGEQANFPVGNVFELSYTGLFVNFNGGLDGNYRLAGGTRWDNAASDGTDIGADVDAVERATLHSTDGAWNSGLTVCRWSTTPACQQQ